MALGRPHIAIVDPNVLATIGLRQLLQTVVPMMAVDVYPTFDAFLAGGGEGCYHYFVAQSVAVAHHLWFMDRRRKTLVLTLSSDPHSQLAGFRHLCVQAGQGETGPAPEAAGQGGRCNHGRPGYRHLRAAGRAG